MIRLVACRDLPALLIASVLVLPACSSGEPDAAPEVAVEKSGPAAPAVATPAPATAPPASNNATAPSNPVADMANAATDAARNAADEATRAVSMPSPELIALGSTTFNAGFCVKCHMEGAVGSDRAPNLTDDEWIHCDGTIDGIIAVIRSGVPEEKLSKPSYPFEMNPVPASKLPDDVARAVAAYIWSLSQSGS